MVIEVFPMNYRVVGPLLLLWRKPWAKGAQTIVGAGEGGEGASSVPARIMPW